MTTLQTARAGSFSNHLRPVLASVTTALEAWLTRAERAHHRRLGFAMVSPDVLRDLRISAEDATGLPGHEADLPFFMQTGFGRR